MLRPVLIASAAALCGCQQTPVPPAADAWRTGTLQCVAGSDGSRSALVAPLLGVERCIGVLALEVAPGREADAATRAAATLIAAQLSTVLGGWPAGSSMPPAEVVPFERVASS